MPASSRMRFMKWKSVSPYWTLNSSFGYCPPVDLPDVLDAPLVEELVDDVGGREVLEDPVIAPLVEVVEDRHDAQVVGRLDLVAAVLGVRLLHVGADAAPHPAPDVQHVDVAGHDPEARGLPDDGADVDRRVLGAGPHRRGE